MKKKYFLFATFLIVSNVIFANEYPFEGVDFIEDLFCVYRFENCIFTVSTADINEIWTVNQYSYQIKKDSSYLIADIKAESSKKMKDGSLISESKMKPDKNRLYIFSADSKHLVIYDCNKKKSIWLTRQQGAIDETYIYSSPHYGASSFLTETLHGEKVSYVPENLSLSALSSSWVEGVDGHGMDESISFVNCGIGSRRIYIINGFFSPEKPYLFYYNSRVKTFLVNCFDDQGNLVNTEKITLEDTGEMQVLEFSGRYASFEFVIKEIYPGSKYQDTAITGIFIDALDLYKK